MSGPAFARLHDRVGRPASFNATCTGTTAFNSIWGEGIVDALAAVSQKIKNKEK